MSSSLDGPEARQADSVDLTNIAIQVEDRPSDQQGRSSSCSGSLVSLISRSGAVRYVAVATLVGLLVFLLERFLGTSAVSNELRSSLLDILSSGGQNGNSPNLHNTATKAPAI
jgi:hypothetical protein